jgi:hypothetical protein
VRLPEDILKRAEGLSEVQRQLLLAVRKYDGKRIERHNVRELDFAQHLLGTTCRERIEWRSNRLWVVSITSTR